MMPESFDELPELRITPVRPIRERGAERNISEGDTLMNEFLLLAVVMLYVAVSYRPGNLQTSQRRSRLLSR
jgi:hypothetical protein